MYDSANQLIRENNQKLGKTWTWSYDSAGNILCKREYNYTTGALLDTVNYTYGDSGWGDLLTGYDGRTITYDEIGNPLNDGRRTYTWERGRRVSSINGSDMYYDSDGMLQEQSVGNNWYGYTYREGRLTRFDVAIGSNEYSMIINYDANGTPISLKCTAWYYDVDTSDEASYTDTYYYLVNPQGDVIGLTNSRGDLIVSYNYDAWGKLLSPNYGSDNSALDCDVADLNPLRYRGYIYDVESGLYYLQSRYYDPEMGRFINADAYVSTGQGLLGYNMFAYCLNNPVNLSDYNGEISLEISLGVLAIVAIAVFVVCAAVITYRMVNAVLTLTLSNSTLLSKEKAIPSEDEDEKLPQKGLVEGDPNAPPVNAGKQGKHVPGHNNYQKDKSSWPKGKNGVRQTQEAWQNGVPDPKKPDGSVRIGKSSDGIIVRVHMDSSGTIHGYPLRYIPIIVGVIVNAYISKYVD